MKLKRESFVGAMEVVVTETLETASDTWPFFEKQNSVNMMVGRESDETLTDVISALWEGRWITKRVRTRIMM